MSNIDTVKNKGEQLSFHQIFTSKGWKIEIPIIQRDYAQGRNSASIIRDNFLEALKEHLVSSDHIDLDFVYGSINKNHNQIFIPLDGQQRLTTLFLLHWYLALLDKKFVHFQSFIISGNKSNFSYETRQSAHEFCNELVKAEIDLSDLLNNSVSQTIKNNAWYYNLWDNDPTIKAMLTMLDAIHIKFDQQFGLYERLTNSENPVITFQFLNLEKFGLTDDLYIKMNARGKQLTDFENFKAKFEQQIADVDSELKYKLNFDKVIKDVTAQEYFSYKIDTVWAYLFWNYRNTNVADDYFDDEIMNFIRLVITNHYAVVGTDEKKVSNIQMLIGRDYNDPNLTYQQYKDLNCFDKSLISDLISIFDLLTNGDKTIKTYLNSHYFNEGEVFELSLSNKTGYRDKLRFHALYKYLIKFESTEGLASWMRVIYNLTENFIYNRPQEYIRSIQEIDRILPYSSKIIEYLADIDNKLGGFPDIQIYEERIKANLILKSQSWQKAINIIEDHGYFTGQIGFILNFSGIDEYFDEHKNCKWDEESDNKFLRSFTKYSKKAKAIFTDDGLFKHRHHLFHRALLSKGDYLLYKNSNFSFLIDDERDTSWKRLLRDNNEDRRIYFKKLLDDKRLKINELEDSLKTIVRESNIDDWRTNFILFPEIIEYLGFNKFIRWISDKEIYLLKKMRLSGEHAEYYSYAFFIKHLKKPISPFTNVGYYSTSGNEEIPCAFMDGWKISNANFAIDIRYYHENDNYEVRFFNRNNKSTMIENEVEQILSQRKMSISNEYERKSFIRLLDSEEKAIRLIKRLCQELNNI